MIAQQAYHFFKSKHLQSLFILAGVATFMIVNVLLDFLITCYHNSIFYLSESLLFSSYWLLFFPILLFGLKFIKEQQKTGAQLLITLLAIAFHLILYPALVWIISKIFYNNTFEYWQTFHFGLSAYFIKTVLIYWFSYATYMMLGKKIKSSQAETVVNQNTESPHFIHSILISDKNKKFWLQIEDILYISANSPYIYIYHPSKRYLHSQTLKLLQTQLDDRYFVRIHKSHIVNIQKISSVQSRQNGDYDITLVNNIKLRVSRNYAKSFKEKFALLHHLTTK